MTCESLERNVWQMEGIDGLYAYLVTPDRSRRRQLLHLHKIQVDRI